MLVYVSPVRKDVARSTVMYSPVEWVMRVHKFFYEEECARIIIHVFSPGRGDMRYQMFFCKEECSA